MSELRAQSGEKLLVDIVEAAVAENHDQVFWPKHRKDSVHNCVRILLVERRPAGFSDRRNNLIWLQPLIVRDLFEPGDLRAKNTARHLEPFSALLLKDRTATGIRQWLEHRPQPPPTT